jgi:hypothetical protein
MTKKIFNYRFFFTLLISFYLSFTSVYAASQFEWRVLLHFSGMQRMLTQKMSKEILLMTKDINFEENKHNLKKSIIHFTWILEGLRNGSKKLRLIKIQNVAILKQLTKVAKLWQKFQKILKRAIVGKISSTDLKKLAVQNLQLLGEMDKAVNLYEQESTLTLKMAQGHTINLAGKQRMLTQKMTKEILLIANNISPKKNQVNLKKTIALFDRTLKGLLKGDSGLGLQGTRNSVLSQQLRLIEKLWKTYKSLLMKKQYSQEDLIKAAELNMPLLKEINNVVKMYIIFLK